jgi:hypothetical protein
MRASTPPAETGQSPRALTNTFSVELPEPNPSIHRQKHPELVSSAATRSSSRLATSTGNRSLGELDFEPGA